MRKGAFISPVRVAYEQELQTQRRLKNAQEYPSSRTENTFNTYTSSPLSKEGTTYDLLNQTHTSTSTTFEPTSALPSTIDEDDILPLFHEKAPQSDRRYPTNQTSNSLINTINHNQSSRILRANPSRPFLNRPASEMLVTSHTRSFYDKLQTTRKIRQQTDEMLKQGIITPEQLVEAYSEYHSSSRLKNGTSPER